MHFCELINVNVVPLLICFEVFKINVIVKKIIVI